MGGVLSVEIVVFAPPAAIPLIWGRDLEDRNPGLLHETEEARAIAPGRFYSDALQDPEGPYPGEHLPIALASRGEGLRFDDADVQGTIVTSRAPYNPEWSFHLEPTIIGFFEMQIEVCDANVTYVEEHLDEIGGSTLPRNFWCPWSSRLFAEVTKNIDPATERPIRPFDATL